MQLTQEDIKKNTDSTYGERLIKDLSIRLTEEFGKGYGGCTGRSCNG